MVFITIMGKQKGTQMCDQTIGLLCLYQIEFVQRSILCFENIFYCIVIVCVYVIQRQYTVSRFKKVFTHSPGFHLSVGSSLLKHCSEHKLANAHETAVYNSILVHSTDYS